ncbi:MFS transporter [Sporosarcina sp. G11-34]|uniref:MFS transporter n=1 Tax=Sporosarcina sp. G11-34 TaxID=2849605 RepID=UPI0022A90747|nr:MFS transporter [Sporosarcina sp. G11-34]MCZ2257906.1 MFS transporter [Sporosarcina sp. G11-34]
MVKKEPIWTRPFISLFITNITVFIVFYGLVTTLPLYAIGVLNRTDEEAGLLMTTFLLSAIVVRPFTGKILDVAGKRKMLWIALVLYLVCTVLYYFIKPFEVLLVLRFLQGIWFSIITTAALSIAADIVPIRRRGAGLGYFTMSTNLAVVLGPLIALYVIQSYSFDVLFIVLSMLMVVGVLMSISAPVGVITEKSLVKNKLKIGDLFEKEALPVAILGSMIALSYASVLSYLSIYAQEKGLLTLASTFFLVFAAVMLLTRPFTGRLFDEKGPKYVIIPGFISFAIGLVLLANMDAAVGFLVAGAFIGFGYGALVPSFQTLAVQSTKHERSGYATATFFTFFDTGLAIGSYVLGLIAIHFGYQYVYLTSGALVFVVFVIYMAIERRKSQKHVSDLVS